MYRLVIIRNSRQTGLIFLVLKKLNSLEYVLLDLESLQLFL
jgi:hypothetical protein